MIRRIVVWLIIIFLLLWVLFLVLSYLPAFTITQVQVKVNGTLEHVPNSISTQLSTLVGQGILRHPLRSIKKQIEQRADVKEITLRRSLPSTIRATITFIDSPVLIQSTNKERSYLADGRALIPIDSQDVGVWASQLLLIEVPLEYALLMERYGTDSIFAAVMALGGDLSGEASLITHIKYDNNSSNSFGKMVLDLPSSNAQLWVREAVDLDQVKTALYWIEQDQKENLSFLRSDVQRYDLYREALVRR